MIAVSVPYDIIFVAHLMVGLATVVVLSTLRVAGLALSRGLDIDSLRRFFPARTNHSARVVHLLPLTGLALSGLGGADVSLGHTWILVGLAMYVLAAGHLEARLLPAERRLAQRLASGEVPSTREGRRFVGSVDVVLALLGVALVAMIVQI